MRADPDLYARAKANADIEAVAGTPLFRAGRRLRGECPLCGASKGKKNGGAFSAEPTAKVWNCFACGEKGDVIDLEAALSKCSPREAAERLAGAAPPPNRVRPAAAPAVDAPKAPAKKLAWIDRVMEESRPGSGTPVAAYLAGRGIEGPVAQEALGGWLRFHPRTPYAWDGEAHEWRTCPAMIAIVRSPTATGGVHCTYLGRTGPGGAWGKAAFDPAKRMWGPQADPEGRPGGAMLARGMTPWSPILVAEGIESALSAAILTGWTGRILATLALDRLQGGWLRDRWGRLVGETVQADPAKPPLTWTNVEEAVLAVDRDMSAIRVKARKPQGGTYERMLSADDRARICAGLAEQAWRAAGANRVRVIAPGAGRDFNDELLSRERA